jgi:hypothetical protein
MLGDPGVSSPNILTKARSSSSTRMVEMSSPGYVRCLRHPHAEDAFPELEAELSKRLGVTVSRGSRGGETARLLLYVVLPVGARLDASVVEETAELERKMKVRVIVVVLRFGDTVHLSPATLSPELTNKAVQLAYTSKGFSELSMTREGLVELGVALRQRV